MEDVEGADFSIFDPGNRFSCSGLRTWTNNYNPFDIGSGSVEDTCWYPQLNLELLEYGNPYTSSYKQQIESGNTPFTFSSGEIRLEPLCLDGPLAIEYNPDIQRKDFAPSSPLTLSSSDLQTNLQFNCNGTYLNDHDVSSPPPSLSMSSSLSSQSSSSSYDSIPFTTRRRRGKQLMHHETRLLLSASSQKKREILENAVIFQNQTPTGDETSFLAKSLHIDKSILQSWHDDLKINGVISKPKPLKVGRVASWKQIIIRRGLQKVKTPSTCQIAFLAAGLRISVEQLWKSVKEYPITDTPGRAKREGRIGPELRSTVFQLGERLPQVDDTVPAVESKREPCTNVKESANVFLLSNPSTVSLDSSGSSPRPPFMESETKPDNPLTIIDTKSQTFRNLQSIVCKIESVEDCEQLGERNSGASKIHATSNTCHHNTESIDDEDVPNLSPEEELAALLGPEYGHLAETFSSRFATASDWDLWQFPSGSRQRAGGAETTPASSSSQTPGNTSSPNTSASGSSSDNKRNYPGGGGDGGGDSEQNNGDGNMNPPPAKKVKPTPIRYACPIYRRSQMAGEKVRSCALNGLEFRNLWDHLRKAHYGCEICGLRLNIPRADKTHLREREKDPSICHKDRRNGATFDIDIDEFAGLEEIYYEHGLSAEDKCKKWWKLLFPDAGEAPDPRHHDIISISTADIGTNQENFHNMWRATPLLPVLDEKQSQTVSTLIEKMILAGSIMKRHRHQNTQPRTPRTPVTAPNMHAVAHADGPSPSTASYTAPTQEQEFGWSPDILLNFENTYNSSSQEFPGPGTLSFPSSASTSFGQDYGGTGNLSYGQNT